MARATPAPTSPSDADGSRRQGNGIAGAPDAGRRPSRCSASPHGLPRSNRSSSGPVIGLPTR